MAKLTTKQQAKKSAGAAHLAKPQPKAAKPAIPAFPPMDLEVFGKILDKNFDKLTTLVDHIIEVADKSSQVREGCDIPMRLAGRIACAEDALADALYEEEWSNAPKEERKALGDIPRIVSLRRKVAGLRKHGMAYQPY